MDVLRYMDALQLKAAKFKTTVKGSFCGSFMLLLQRLLTSVTQQITAVSTSVDNSRYEVFVGFTGGSLNFIPMLNVSLTDWQVVLLLS